MAILDLSKKTLIFDNYKYSCIGVECLVYKKNNNHWVFIKKITATDLKKIGIVA